MASPVGKYSLYGEYIILCGKASLFRPLNYSVPLRVRLYAPVSVCLLSYMRTEGKGPGEGVDAALLQPPQSSRATSTMSASFAFCSSIVSALPSTVDEKPHCPLRQSCSSGTYLVASSMRRLSASLLSRSGRLVVTSPSTIFLRPRGTKRSGANPPERASSYSRKYPSTASSPNNASATWS